MVVEVVADKDYEGVTVLPRRGVYELVIKPVGKMDLLLVTTCHREESFNPKSKGFFKQDNSFKYRYTPQKGIEDIGSCTLRMDAFDKERGQHSWFMADFEGPKEQLKAQVTCNGEKKLYTGVSVCQSKAGLIQRIEFDEEVKYPPDPKCPIDGSFYKIPLGECVYVFRGMKSGKIHRHTTIGYQGILVREVK